MTSIHDWSQNDKRIANYELRRYCAYACRTMGCWEEMLWVAERALFDSRVGDPLRAERRISQPQT